MKKLSKITESIWSDMQDRSSGDVVRKEDEINLLDVDQLYDYIKSNYKDKVPYIDMYSFGPSPGQKRIYVEPIKGITLDTIYDENTGDLEHILIIWKGADVDGDFICKLKDRFQFEETLTRWDGSRIKIKEKDGSCKNQTYIDLINIFLDNIKLF